MKYPRDNRTLPVIVGRRIIDDERVSINTVGVWLLMKAMPGGIPLTIESVAKMINGDRDRALRIAEEAMQELADCGYIAEGA